MQAWKKALVLSGSTILKTIECIDKSAIGIALVVDEHLHLLGVVTDGDIRRALLKNIALDSPINNILSENFKFAKEGDSTEHMIGLMQSFSIRHIPILNDEYQLINLETFDSLLRPKKRDNLVVLMAGGLGTRLRPLTENCPKPLLKIESKPLLQITMERFIELGFHQFIITTHYRREMIREHFNDGSQWGVRIDYLHEEEPLGTAGALGLLNFIPESPFIVMNGDIITRTNFQHLVDFHNQQQGSLTVATREYKQTIPYGVVNIEHNQLVSLEEKPSHYFYVNGGIYVISPDVLKFVERNVFLDMPGLINLLLKSNMKINSFLIREYWADIGRIEDFEQAREDYQQYFI